MREAGLFDGVLARGRVREAVDDAAWLQAMLDVEAALARATAKAGLISEEDAETIAAACGAAHYDAAEIGRAAASSGNPAAPLVKALTERVEGPAAGHVHSGATSQDIVDSAAMLVAHRALGPLLDDLRGAASAAARLAREHRATLLPGRTLLQQAVPVTLGLKAAGWLVGLDEAADRLATVRDERLAVQFGGAAGTLASLGDHGVEVMAGMARELGLTEPVLPWHTIRTRPAELAGALGTACGVVAKAARDVALMAQTEVAEVAEGASGGSSTMPHKRNPVAAVSASGCAMQAPGLVATLLGAMAHEHERAAGSWHAEWRPLTELLRSTGSAASWLRTCLEELEVDAAAMRANLDITEGLLMAERVSTELAPELGRLQAHEAVQRASQQSGDVEGGFAAALAQQPEVRDRISEERLAELLDPAGYLGSADIFIDRALRAHDAREARA
jgi:3-carboxy-cis,cis-muconate cycloisomerase